jgi:MoxR-like ATPase
LPEAQLDRFLLYIKVDYPSGKQEWEIARRVTSGLLGRIDSVLSPEKLIEAQALVERMPACDHVVGYSWAVVRASRPDTPEALDFINKWVNWGAGPRGVLALVSCAKARAFLHGRYHAAVEDVQAIIEPALRHRIAPNYAALAANVNSDKLIALLMEGVPADKLYEPPVE